MTTDPVLHALVDLVEWIETNRDEPSIFNSAYRNALKVIREHTAPGGERSGPSGEDKRRIDACVRACEGFQTEWLEQNSFWSYALLTSDEYAELVVAKRELTRLSATLESNK